MLQGIVSTVPEKIRERLVFIREKICTVSGVEIMPPVFKPHITWQVVDQYDIPAVKAALEEVAGKMKTLDVVTTGLGVFSGPKPIVYIPVVRTPDMTRIHEKLQNSTAKFARTEWELFQPERWMPHITLLPADIALDKLPCVFEQLIYEDFHWKFQIDNFEVFQQNDDQSIMDIARFEFGG